MDGFYSLQFFCFDYFFLLGAPWRGSRARKKTRLACVFSRARAKKLALCFTQHLLRWLGAPASGWKKKGPGNEVACTDVLLPRLCSPGHAGQRGLLVTSHTTSGQEATVARSRSTQDIITKTFYLRLKKCKLHFATRTVFFI